MRLPLIMLTLPFVAHAETIYLCLPTTSSVMSSSGTHAISLHEKWLVKHIPFESEHPVNTMENEEDKLNDVWQFKRFNEDEWRRMRQSFPGTVYWAYHDDWESFRFNWHTKRFGWHHAGFWHTSSDSELTGVMTSFGTCSKLD